MKDKLNEMAKRLGESDPLASSAMKDAADQLQSRGTAAKVGEAADQLEKNRMGAARTGQEKARQDLKEVVDAVQNRRERELARLVKELKAAESELRKLRQRQTQNLEKSREAGKTGDPGARQNALKRLAKEQAEIKKELGSQLRRLAKLSAEAAAKAGARASSKMGKAEEGLDQGEAGQAEKEQDEALADLEEAQERLAETRRDAEEQLAMEQFSKMGDELTGLAQRQEKVAADTSAFEKLRGEKQGKLTVGQRTGIRNLGAVQEGLKDEASGLTEKLSGAPVFELTMKRAADGMETTAKRLHALKTGPRDPARRRRRHGPD